MIIGLRCSVCGRFCRPVDSSTPFGGYNSTEPPEEEYYCGKCVLKEKDWHIAHGWLPSNWRKAKWEYEVAKVLGCILIGPKYSAWSVWHKATEPIPDDYDVIWTGKEE